ncbi:hypothetical protein L810_4148 [Burkholderia sp. AU4i]|nr:hypothetical protein L810_4148 [Burkholderia sp. AU4i]
MAIASSASGRAAAQCATIRSGRRIRSAPYSTRRVPFTPRCAFVTLCMPSGIGRATRPTARSTSPHRRIATSHAVGNLTGLHPAARCGAPDTFTHALFSSALRGVRTNCHTQDLTIQGASASGFNTRPPARAKRERVMPPGRVRLVAKPHTNVNINEIVNRTNSKYE